MKAREIPRIYQGTESRKLIQGCNLLFDIHSDY